MAIYHAHSQVIGLSSGRSAVAAAAYRSGSNLVEYTNSSYGVTTECNWDYSKKHGVAFSYIFTPDNVPSWAHDRGALWNKVTSFEKRKDGQLAREFDIALPVELSEGQNIDLISEIAKECFVKYGMIADVNLHLDNPSNPHAHIMLTLRDLVTLENGQIDFGLKNRLWNSKVFLANTREQISLLTNKHLELHGYDSRISHLSHKDREIDLEASIHVGPISKHMTSYSDRKEINSSIIQQNAAAIRQNPELVFQKLSINKPVFTKEDIAIALSDALSSGIELETNEIQTKSIRPSASEKGHLTQAPPQTQNRAQDDLRILSKQIVQDNIPDLPIDDVESLNLESLNSEYTNEFLQSYSAVMQSSKISLINPCDLKGRTLYALTKRLELEQRFINAVEELHSNNSHNLNITKEAIDELSHLESFRQSAKEIARYAQESINDKTGLNLNLLPKTQQPLTEEQKDAITNILNGPNLSVLEGWPGTGKTFVMKEIVHQYQKAGYKIIGTAPSSSAAQVLSTSTGIEALNTTLLRKQWQLAKNEAFELALRADYYKEEQYKDKPITNHLIKLPSSNSLFSTNTMNSKTVLIIDEASMVELASMDYLLSNVQAAGAKVILVGDNNQFTAVGMTGAFKKAATIAGSHKLTQVMRHSHQDPQIQELQRQATELVGQYKINEAMSVYDKLNVFSIHDNEQTTKEALIKDYIDSYLDIAENIERDDLSSIRSIVIGAYTNKSVNHFNTEVREKLKQSGILKGKEHEFKSGNNLISITKGEQIVFETNKALYDGFGGVLNGEVGTILNFTKPNEFGHGIFKTLVHKADGSKKVVLINTAEEKHSVRFKHGYAVTGYKLQGETVDHMKVYYEPIIGYEAFNVLMSRYRYDVKLYGANDILENIVYGKVGEDPYSIRAKYEIEAYSSKKEQGDKSTKTQIPAWYIGLTLGISKRVDNNLSLDYKSNLELTDNEQVLKGYLESRRLVFELHGKMQNWKDNQQLPLKLSALHLHLVKNNSIKFQKPREIHIDPYGLVYNGLLTNSPSNSLSNLTRSNTPTPWSGLSKKEQEQLIWQGLPLASKAELEAIYHELEKAKSDLKDHALSICTHYKGWVDFKLDAQLNTKLQELKSQETTIGAEGFKQEQKQDLKVANELREALGKAAIGIETSLSKSQVTMESRLIQLNLNYETILKHAEISPLKYFLKPINHNHSLVLNKSWGELMQVCQELSANNSTGLIHSIKNSNFATNRETGSNSTTTISNIAENINILDAFINETNSTLTDKQKQLAIAEESYLSLTKEIEQIINYRDVLFPEFLSRVYKVHPSEIIKSWKQLKDRNEASFKAQERLPEFLNLINQNPQLLGSLKGIGLGGVIGITKGRKDAINNLEAISTRFKDYEDGEHRMRKLNDQLREGDYEFDIKVLHKEISDLKLGLPNKHEQDFLTKVNLLQKNNNLTLDSLTKLARTEEAIGLILEYYNTINDSLELSKNLNKGLDNNPDKDLGKNLDQESALQIRKERKFRPRIRNNVAGSDKRYGAQTSSLTFEQVKNALSSSDYETLFRQYAHRINYDGVIKKQGQNINCGSLSMNLTTGLWSRFSSSQGGDIFHFIEEATGASKKGTLEILAQYAGIEQHYQQDYYSNSLQQAKPLNSAEAKLNELTRESTKLLAKESINEWIAYKTVPAEAQEFNPDKHLSYLLQDNILSTLHEYQNTKGEVIGYTVRLIEKNQDLELDPTRANTSRKQVLPVTFCYNEGLDKNGWRLKGFSDEKGNKPIYGVEKLNQDIKTILIVEGEKTADKAQILFPEFTVISWLGGTNGATKVDWSSLNGRSVVIFPDNDEPGIKAAEVISERLNHINENIGKVSIVNPKDLNLPEKWDLADEVPAHITIDDIANVIAKTQGQEASLAYAKEVELTLTKELKTKSVNELASNELNGADRILWQKRSNGKIIDKQEIKSLAKEESLWKEILSSKEAIYFTKYKQTKGGLESAHSFLKLSDPLYRDSLVAVAISTNTSKVLRDTDIQNTQNIESISHLNQEELDLKTNLPTLINDLEDKYEAKKAAFYTSNTYTSLISNDNYCYFVGGFYAREDRQELYKALAQDLVFLHKEQLGNNSLSKIHIEAIAEITNCEIRNYSKPKARGSSADKLETYDKTKIAASLHKITQNKDWWKDLAQKTIAPSMNEQRMSFEQYKSSIDLLLSTLDHSSISLNQASFDKVKETTYVHAYNRWLISGQALEPKTNEIKALVGRSLYEVTSMAQVQKQLRSSWQYHNDSPIPLSRRLEIPIEAELILKTRGFALEQIALANPDQFLHLGQYEKSVESKVSLALSKRNEQIDLALKSNKSLQLIAKSIPLEAKIIAEQLIDHELQYRPNSITTEKFKQIIQSANDQMKLYVELQAAFKEEKVIDKPNSKELQKDIQATLKFAGKILQNTTNSKQHEVRNHKIHNMDNKHEHRQLINIDNQLHTKIVTYTIKQIKQMQQQLHKDQKEFELTKQYTKRIGF